MRKLSIILVALVIFSSYFAWKHIINMPGESYPGPLPPLTEPQKLLSQKLSEHVSTLAGDIGERNVFTYEALKKAAFYIEEQMKLPGGNFRRQEYTVNGKLVWNLELEYVGNKKPEEILIIGAHYDTDAATPGANDNASGVAALITLAQHFADRELSKTVRFLAFVNEEMPFFSTPEMGSRVYAKESYEKKENIIGMISLETIGYYTEEENTQKYPFPVGLFYPDRGNFIAFVGNTGSKRFLEKSLSSFRRSALFPSEGAALPAALPGIGWSDHSSFWEYGYEAIMVTDTAPFRYPYYHAPGDTPDKLDYEAMARIVEGLQAVIESLAE